MGEKSKPGIDVTHLDADELNRVAIENLDGARSGNLAGNVGDASEFKEVNLSANKKNEDPEELAKAA